MGRQPDPPGRVGQGRPDRFPDPVNGVRAEPGPEARINLLGRADEPQVALADEVVQGQSAMDVLACHPEHQAQILLYDPVPRLDIAVPGASRELLAIATRFPRLVSDAASSHPATRATPPLHFPDGRIH